MKAIKLSFNIVGGFEIRTSPYMNIYAELKSRPETKTCISHYKLKEIVHNNDVEPLLKMDICDNIRIDMLYRPNIDHVLVIELLKALEDEKTLIEQGVIDAISNAIHKWLSSLRDDERRLDAMLVELKKAVNDISNIRKTHTMKYKRQFTYHMCVPTGIKIIPGMKPWVTRDMMIFDCAGNKASIKLSDIMYRVDKMDMVDSMVDEVLSMINLYDNESCEPIVIVPNIKIMSTAFEEDTPSNVIPQSELASVYALMRYNGDNMAVAIVWLNSSGETMKKLTNIHFMYDDEYIKDALELYEHVIDDKMQAGV